MLRLDVTSFDGGVGVVVRARLLVVSLVIGASLMVAAAGSSAVPAASGTAGSLAVIAGLNHSVIAPGSATATPVAARGVAVDSSGNIYIADAENNVIEKVSGGNVSIIAGTGVAGAPTNGPATSSDLNHPDAVAVDGSGNVYIADTNNNRVEEVSSGTLTIIAGTGTIGPPTAGPATSSDLWAPAGVAVDGSGNVYIADTDNNRVEKVTSGTLSVFAGTGTSGAPTPGTATSSDLAQPFGVAVDSTGNNVYIADTDNSEIEKVTSGTLSIFAGTGTSGAPTNGAATSSDLSFPSDVAVDASGNVYIADRLNQRVEEVTTGTLSVLAGTGGMGAPTAGTATSSPLYDPAAVAVDSSGAVYIADGSVGVVAKVSSGTMSVAAGLITYGLPTLGTATSSKLSTPSGVAADSSGNVYIADTNNNLVEKLTSSGTLSVLAGVPGHIGTPTPGPAVSSNLNKPAGVAVDGNGNVYIADTVNNVIEKVTPSGTLSVLAGIAGHFGAPTPGPATHSDLNKPGGVAVDSSGNVYIADSSNNQVEKVTPAGTLSIFAGTGTAGAPTPGAATSSDLDDPSGVAVDASGNVYVADTKNNVIEQVTPAGALSIIAGTGTESTPTPGPALSSALDDPSGVVVDRSGNVFIADYDNNLIEKVTPGGTLSFVAGNGNGAPPTPGPALSSALRGPAGVALDPFGNLYIADQANSDVEEVFGVATTATVDPTATSLSCAPASVTTSAATTCTATVTDTAAGPLAPTGTVSFVSAPTTGAFSSSGACQLTAAATIGVASCQVSFTPSAAGSYTVTARYGGDSLHQASQNAAAVTAQQPSTTGTGPGGGTKSSPGRGSIYRLRVAGTVLNLRAACAGTTSCKLRLKLTVRETLKRGKVIAVAARTKVTKRTVTVGSGSVVVKAGSSRSFKLSLNRLGRALLAKHSPLRAKLVTTQSGRTINTSTVTFKAKKKTKKKH